MNEAIPEGQVPDIYGQLHPTETPELIARKLKEFQLELIQLPSSKKARLLQAQQRCPDLLTKEFQLMFLRCEIFNADLAAARYASYWEKRFKVFGARKAFLPLTLDGALSEDREVLDLGVLRLVDGATDPVGRSILFMNPAQFDSSRYSRESFTRAFWYLTHAALETDAAQKHGVIFLAFARHAKFSQFDLKLDKMMMDGLKEGIPLRLSGMHLCHPPMFIALIWPMIKFGMGKKLRNRCLVHCGTTEKVLQVLATQYGLKRSSLPAEIGGGVVLNHRKLLNERQSAGL